MAKKKGEGEDMRKSYVFMRAIMVNMGQDLEIHKTHWQRRPPYRPLLLPYSFANALNSPVFIHTFLYVFFRKTVFPWGKKNQEMNKEILNLSILIYRDKKFTRLIVNISIFVEIQKCENLHFFQVHIIHKNNNFFQNLNYYIEK